MLDVLTHTTKLSIKEAEAGGEFRSDYIARTCLKYQKQNIKEKKTLQKNSLECVIWTHAYTCGIILVNVFR